jgi:hypothetical protein
MSQRTMTTAAVGTDTTTDAAADTATVPTATRASLAAHNLLELLDEHKTGMPDAAYMALANGIAGLHNTRYLTVMVSRL